MPWWNGCSSVGRGSRALSLHRPRTRQPVERNFHIGLILVDRDKMKSTLSMAQKMWTGASNVMRFSNRSVTIPASWLSPVIIASRHLLTRSLLQTNPNKVHSCSCSLTVILLTLSGTIWDTSNPYTNFVRTHLNLSQSKALRFKVSIISLRSSPSTCSIASCFIWRPIFACSLFWYKFLQVGNLARPY